MGRTLIDIVANGSRNKERPRRKWIDSVPDGLKEKHLRKVTHYGTELSGKDKPKTSTWNKEKK